jgi:tRNA threonylcarbamoyladenosine biosynthesis protein TsaE
MTREITTNSAEDTIALGRTLAEMLGPPKLVLLRGELGAGKTTMVKGIAAAFEAAAEEDVTSPTFTLVHEYRGPRANLYHIDLYRVETQRELETLGLDDMRTDDSVLLIEWGEKFPRLRRERDVEISLERVSEKVIPVGSVLKRTQRRALSASLKRCPDTNHTCITNRTCTTSTQNEEPPQSVACNFSYVVSGCTTGRVVQESPTPGLQQVGTGFNC